MCGYCNTFETNCYKNNRLYSFLCRVHVSKIFRLELSSKWCCVINFAVIYYELEVIKSARTTAVVSDMGFDEEEDI